MLQCFDACYNNEKLNQACQCNQECYCDQDATATVMHITGNEAVSEGPVGDKKSPQ